MAKIKTDWDFTLLYKNDKDPQIEADFKAAEEAYGAFAKKYAGRDDYLRDEKKLATALADYEKLSADLAAEKPLLYFLYKKDLNGKDVAVQARANVLTQRYNQLANKIIFFPVALSQIALTNQKSFLANKSLEPYRYFLKRTFDEAKHVLSEEEEKILNLKSLPGRSLWIDGNEKILSKQEIKWKGKLIPLAEAAGKFFSLSTKDRRALAALINQKLESISDFAENELNALVTDKKIDDELRKYEKPYSATVLHYQNETQTVENLVAVVTEAFPLAHRFYKLKAKMLGLKSLAYADRSARVGKAGKQFPFDQAVEIVRKGLGKIDPVYAATLDEFLLRGQIDAFPKTGKAGGAYCSSGDNMPTFVLLNHVSDFRSVTTLAHEMGHALHTKFSFASQPPLYRHYTIATAEVASTFFENAVFDEIFPLLSPKEQVIALHDKLNDSVSTIFRQIACFNFELELHNQIREKGSLPKEEIAKLMNKHMKAYLGPVFKLEENDGYFFVYWSHLRRHFYVYTYAMGEIVSSALYQSYKQNPQFNEEVKKFLSAGSSASPEDIFARAGIDVRDPKFFELGLKKIEADINKLESLLKK